jgi:hypothetical protein
MRPIPYMAFWTTVALACIAALVKACRYIGDKLDAILQAHR